MAYITISNSKKIIQKLDENTLDSVTEAIYKRDIYFFSKRESGNMKGIRELFRDLENFILLYYKPIQVVDSFRYVFPESQPSYHYDASCSRLHSNFQNFEIPEFIRSQGKEAVVEFRNWYKTSNFKSDDPKDYIIALTKKYPGVGSINPKSISHNNSGVEKKENYDLAELEREIDDLLKKADDYFNDNPNIRDIIYRYQKMTFLGYINGPLNNNRSGLNDEELKRFLKAYDETFKEPVKTRLIEYYKIKFNPDMNFEGKLLEKLGFRACTTCMQ